MGLFKNRSVSGQLCRVTIKQSQIAYIKINKDTVSSEIFVRTKFICKNSLLKKLQFSLKMIF